MVSTVVLQLVGERRLALGDTVARRLGPILPYAHGVTVRKLLNHTSGIPDNALPPAIEIFKGDPFRRWRPAQLVGARRRPAAGVPRRRRLVVLQHELHAARDDDRAHHRAHRSRRRSARILRPLGLRDSSMPLYEPTARRLHARGYSLDYDDDLNPIPGTLRDVTVHGPSGDCAAGNLVSTERTSRASSARCSAAGSSRPSC